jgi:hypothetical protein
MLRQSLCDNVVLLEGVLLLIKNVIPIMKVADLTSMS